MKNVSEKTLLKKERRIFKSGGSATTYKHLSGPKPSDKEMRLFLWHQMMRRASEYRGSIVLVAR